MDIFTEKCYFRIYHKSKSRVGLLYVSKIKNCENIGVFNLNFNSNLRAEIKAILTLYGNSTYGMVWY